MAQAYNCAPRSHFYIFTCIFIDVAAGVSSHGLAAGTNRLTRRRRRTQVKPHKCTVSQETS